jgi:hypothetical protein
VLHSLEKDKTEKGAKFKYFSITKHWREIQKSYQIVGAVAGRRQGEIASFHLSGHFSAANHFDDGGHYTPVLLLLLLLLLLLK